MESPLYAGEGHARLAAGIPFPPLTPYADQARPQSPSEQAFDQSPGRRLFTQGATGMGHRHGATPARTSRTSQPSLQKEQVAAGTMQKLREVLRKTSRGGQCATEDRQQAQEKLLQESSTSLRQTGPSRAHPPANSPLPGTPPPHPYSLPTPFPPSRHPRWPAPSQHPDAGLQPSHQASQHISPGSQPLPSGSRPRHATVHQALTGPSRFQTSLARPAHGSPLTPFTGINADATPAAQGRVQPEQQHASRAHAPRTGLKRPAVLQAAHPSDLPPPTEQLNKSHVSPMASPQPFLGSPSRMPYRTQALGNPSPTQMFSTNPSAAHASRTHQPGLATPMSAAPPTPSFKFSRQHRQHPSDAPAGPSSPTELSQLHALHGSPSRSSRPGGIGSPQAGGHAKRGHEATGPQNEPKGRQLGMGSPWASQQPPTGTADTKNQPVPASLGVSLGSSSSSMGRGLEGKGWGGMHDARHAVSSRAAPESLQLAAPLRTEDRKKSIPMGFKPMVVSEQAASIQGRLGAGVFKRKQPAVQCNRGLSTSSADAQPSTATHSSVQEPAGLFSRGPAAALFPQTSSSATTTGGEGKQAQTLPGASGSRSSSAALASPSQPGQPDEPLPGESGQSSSAALAIASSSEQTSQEISQPPADSATFALETASGDASAPSQCSHSTQMLAPSAAAQDQIPAVDLTEAAVATSGLADDAEQHEARGSSSDADDAESRLQTPRAAGRDDDRPDDGLEASGGSEDWTNVPPPGISDGTLGGAEGSLPLRGDGPTVSGSCKEAGPRSRSTAVQLRQQLAHGIPQLVTPLRLPPSPHDTQAKPAELQSQEAVQAALQKLQQLTVEATSLLPANPQGGSEGVVASTPGVAGLVPAHVQRTPSAWAQTAKTRHQDELEEAGSSSSAGHGAGAQREDSEPGWELLSLQDATPNPSLPIKATAASQQALPAQTASIFARLLQLQHRGTALVKG